MRAAWNTRILGSKTSIFSNIRSPINKRIGVSFSLVVWAAFDRNLDDAQGHVIIEYLAQSKFGLS